MADFTIAFDETMINEGGYVDDPDDRGGETYRGVARKFHPKWPGWEIVDKLKAEHQTDFEKQLDENQELQKLVESFYREFFWKPILGDQINDQALANELFDTGVNQGTGSVVKYWQESLNLLNRNGKDYADIAVDGRAGEETLKATDAFLKRNDGRSDKLLKVLNLMQGWRYIEQARKDPTQRKFMHGWLTRVRLT
jgi:lysozyme family protein